MYKRVKEPVVFIVIIAIALLTLLAVYGLHYNKVDLIKGVGQMRYGIDIKGGVDVTFRPPVDFKATDANMLAAKSVLEHRLDNLNITDRELYVDYTNKRIILRFPWKSSETKFDPEEAIAELGAMAQLYIKDPAGNVLLTGSEDVKSAVAEPVSSGGGYEVKLEFTPAGTTKFADATTKFNKQTLGIFLDEASISTPVVNEPILDGTAIISNTSNPMTSTEATTLANNINAGALPFKLETDNFSTISPTLGESALHVMVMAGKLAFTLICLFMIFYYRLPGFFACIALIGHLAGTLLLISAPQYTLTLPGIAGIILSIGMGVDCNIITFERIKEELRLGKTIDGAIDAGFERSFSAIFDGNITVIIVGIILMWLGSGSVKSFGYTLIIGVVFNFIMGIIASRLMLKSISRFTFARKDGFYMRRAAR